MQVDVRFVCPEIVGRPRNGVYDIPENSAITDLIAFCLEENSLELPQNVFDYLLLMLNGKQTKACAKLSPGDKILVLRKMMGG